MSIGRLLEASAALSRDAHRTAAQLASLWVYNPLDYAWVPHAVYIKKYGAGTKHVLFIGMNPGPWGMAQTGIPFGEIHAVRTWMGIEEPVGKPVQEHPKKIVEGFACKKSEVSGKRLWGLVSRKYPDSCDFFARHFVVNYCPLLFLDEQGRNVTPDKLPLSVRKGLELVCDAHLITVIKTTKPAFVIGIGGYAEKKLIQISGKLGSHITIGKILHPSPASPRANAGWNQEAETQLAAYGIW